MVAREREPTVRVTLIGRPRLQDGDVREIGQRLRERFGPVEVEVEHPRREHSDGT